MVRGGEGFKFKVSQLSMVISYCTELKLRFGTTTDINSIQRKYFLFNPKFTTIYT